MKYLLVILSVLMAQQSLANNGVAKQRLEEVSALDCSDSRQYRGLNPGMITISFSEDSVHGPGFYEYSFQGYLRRFHPISQVKYTLDKGILYKVGLREDNTEVVRVRYNHQADEWGSNFVGLFELEYNNGYREKGYTMECRLAVR